MRLLISLDKRWKETYNTMHLPSQHDRMLKGASGWNVALLFLLFYSRQLLESITLDMHEHERIGKLRKEQIKSRKTWYSMSFSACCLSSSLDSLKNLKRKDDKSTLAITRVMQAVGENLCSLWLLGKAPESNVIPVEVCIHCMIHIRHIVFHTVISNKASQRSVTRKF